jgi:hypothetical protein
MFVSYRMNNHVYWTRNRMTIPAGETLISDGENYARVRCGNRLSAVAALPVSLSEPPKEKLENADFVPPLLADLMSGEGSGPFLALSALPDLPQLPAIGPTASSNPPVGFPPLLPPGVTPLTGTIVTPSPVATPEPAALTLLLCGAFCFGALWALLRK